MTFQKNIIAIYQEKGKAWLAELPKKVRYYEDLWKLSSLKPFDCLSYNYVLSGYQGKRPIVLKFSLDSASLTKEIKALKAFQGHGAVSVLDDQEGVVLLERAVPGKSLKEQFGNSQRGLEIACEVIQKMHKAPMPREEDFPRIEEWMAVLDREWNLPKTLLQTARTFKDKLLQSTAPRVLLHGDLHRDNILSHGQGWAVIDPKGVIGWPINEIWACVENPSDLRYIGEFFHFSFDTVVRWYYVHLILAACWQVEDHLSPKTFLDLAMSVLPIDLSK